MNLYFLANSMKTATELVSSFIGGDRYQGLG